MHAIASVKRQFHKRAVAVHRYAAVIEQVAVVPAVYGAYGIEEPGVDLELFAAAEAGDKAVYYILLLGGELIGVGGVYGGKVGIPEGVYRAVYLYGAVLIVYAG